MRKDYFQDLIYAIGTARSLLEKAHSKGSVLEGICLYTSVIDGFLRLAIIYTRTQQSPDHTYMIDKKMIRQDDGEKTYSEKDIYKMALSEGVISDDLYKRLLAIYEFRNKAVHRFNISGISYKQIADKCTEFENIYQEIFDIVAVLEHGPHGIRKASKKEEKLFYKNLAEKILGEGK